MSTYSLLLLICSRIHEKSPLREGINSLLNGVLMPEDHCLPERVLRFRSQDRQ